MAEEMLVLLEAPVEEVEILDQEQAELEIVHHLGHLKVILEELDHLEKMVVAEGEQPQQVEMQMEHQEQVALAVLQLHQCHMLLEELEMGVDVEQPYLELILVVEAVQHLMVRVAE